MKTPVVPIAIVVIMGILAADLFYVSIQGWMTASMAAILFIFVTTRHQHLQAVAILSAFFFLGGAAYTLEKTRRNVHLPPENILYQAVAISDGEVRGKVVRVDIIITNGPLCGRKVRASLLRDSLRRDADRLAAGMGIEAFSRMEHPSNRISTTSHFDYSRWMTVHGFVAGTLIYPDNWLLRTVDITSLSVLQRARLAMLNFRVTLQNHYRAAGFGGAVFAIVSAMTLGNKQALEKSTRDMFSVTGASHLLAVSGMHLGVVYCVLTLFFGNMRRRGSGMLRQYISTLFILLGIWSYAMLTGLSSSVVRAALMLTICSFVTMIEQDSMSMNTLAVAATLLLFINPLSLWDVSFQLSFMAMLGIFLFFRPVYSLFVNARFMRWSVIRAVWAMTAVSIAAQLCTAPLVAYYFQRFSCYFLLTNLFAIPCATIIIYMAVVFFCLQPFSIVQHYVARAISYITETMFSGLNAISTMPCASIDGIRLSLPQVVLLYVVIGCLYGMCQYLPPKK